MGKLIFVTGGARSGKSSFAEEKLRNLEGKTCYIATALPFDQGMQERIKHHQEHRPKEWTTIERYKDFDKLEEDINFIKADNILFDCLTLMTTNQLLERDIDWDPKNIEKIQQIEAEIKNDIKILLEKLKGKNAIIVSNEVGLGIVPDNYFSSYFRDMQGRFNQYITSIADEVYIIFSGLPLQLK